VTPVTVPLPPAPLGANQTGTPDAFTVSTLFASVVVEEGIVVFNVFPVKLNPLQRAISETAVPDNPEPKSLFAVIACIFA
jgi:hypothetical protein